MAEEKKLEKVIGICHKESAALHEILGGCSFVCTAWVRKPNEKDGSKGLLSGSCSENGIALCVWRKQEKSEDKYDRICQYVIGIHDIGTLQGLIDFVMLRFEGYLARGEQT